MSSAEEEKKSLASLDFQSVMSILREVDPASALARRTRDLLAGPLEIQPAPRKTKGTEERKFLTIGTATANDYDGVYFTIQSIRLHHPEILDEVDFLVIDNAPTGPCAEALRDLANWCKNYRYVPYRSAQGTAVRDLLFREAAGEFVLCIDSHVLFAPGSLARFIEYCKHNRTTNDLLQGPLLSDALEPLATHFSPKWSHGMYGVWAMDERGKDASAPPFEVEMQGLGVFGCRREAWPGFNPRLAGFGGEEGYIHEKIRRAGGRTLCLPFLGWMHRFRRPMGVPYHVSWEDRIRNYLLIYDELGLDPAPVTSHFEEFIGSEPARVLVAEAKAEIAGPFHGFDAIYCINLDRQTDRWEAMRKRFAKLGIQRKVRRFPAADTPINHHIGCALSHRRIIAEAKRQELETVLVFEDDAQFSRDAPEVLALAMRELRGREWQLLYLGGYLDKRTVTAVPDCEHLVIANAITCTHAIAYHHTVYDTILNSVPDDPVEIAFWIDEHLAIDQFYGSKLLSSAFIVWPVVATQASILPVETREFED